MDVKHPDTNTISENDCCTKVSDAKWGEGMVWVAGLSAVRVKGWRAPKTMAKYIYKVPPKSFPISALHHMDL